MKKKVKTQQVLDRVEPISGGKTNKFGKDKKIRPPQDRTGELRLRTVRSEQVSGLDDCEKSTKVTTL